MLARRIIPCLDVKDGVVVKGVQFRNHEVMGDIVPLAKRYAEEGADELVFYDITASSDARVVDKSWVSRVAEVIDIPFCVAGGIRSVEDAKRILEFGADKISINYPALANPDLISALADRFGVQCVVVGIDSYFDAANGQYQVKQYTGDETRTRITQWTTPDWVVEVLCCVLLASLAWACASTLSTEMVAVRMAASIVRPPPGQRRKWRAKTCAARPKRCRASQARSASRIFSVRSFL